jgi:DNA-directed RNA polymerase specialized sigma24 family protein
VWVRRALTNLAASAQIAEVLGCSDATVRVHLHNGRRALARRLGLRNQRART